MKFWVVQNSCSQVNGRLRFRIHCSTSLNRYRGYVYSNEEETGKLLRRDFSANTLLDLARFGRPLNCECFTQPFDAP